MGSTRKLVQVSVVAQQIGIVDKVSQVLHIAAQSEDTTSTPACSDLSFLTTAVHPNCKGPAVLSSARLKCSRGLKTCM